MRKKLVMIFCGVLLLTTMFVLDKATSSTSAAPAKSQQTNVAAVSCFGQAFNMGTHTVQSGRTIVLPAATSKSFTTSSHCRDINVRLTRLTNPVQMRVCFHVGSPIPTCSTAKTINQANQWRVLATNVRDGVKYTIDVKAIKGTATFTGLIGG
jgi:hypothetical protein